MAEKEFEVILGPTDWLRVYFETDRTGLVQFTVQYEAEIGGRRRGIVRYDTAHGFPHRDLLSFDGETRRKDQVHLTIEAAYQYAWHDILANWERYRQDFEREARRYE